MKTLVFLTLAAFAPAGSVFAQHEHHSQQNVSDYAGQEHHRIKALSEDEITGYLAGRGMGLARAAELNRFPGPLHVLQLADKLELTPAQKTETQKIFDRMHAEAARLGAELVEKEKTLDAMFSRATVSRDSLQEITAAIGALQARIRLTHLEAHLALRSTLTPAQIETYQTLRGYAAAAPADAAAGDRP